MCNILVDLLVERLAKDEGSLIQIVVDDSIEVSSKLNQAQFDVPDNDQSFQEYSN